MGSLCKKMIALDVMSREVRLSIEGEKGRKNVCGLLLTVLYVAVVATGALYWMDRYFEDSFPTVSTSQHARTTNISIDLSENKLLPIFYAKFRNKFLPATLVPRYFRFGFIFFDSGQDTLTDLPVSSSLLGTERNGKKSFQI